MSSKTKPGSGSSIAVRKRSTTTTTAVGDPVGAASRMAELLNEMEALIPDLVQPDISRIKRISQSAKFGQALIPHVITASTSPPVRPPSTTSNSCIRSRREWRRSRWPCRIR